jgi:chemotaxis methyl-accepting protein methylase
MKNILPLSSEDSDLFQELLIEASGLRFEESRNQSLHLALWQRLQHRGYDSYREYYNLLKFHPEGRLEIRELLDLITIGETYFFRNKAQFNVLMRFVLPEIIKRKVFSGDQYIRAWSAGCSRGDEAYSIAIAIMEVLPSYSEWNISILGTDINRNGLTSSEEAIYVQKDIGHLDKEYLDKYFDIRGSTYVLKEDVKSLVRFEYHNLAKDPFMHERIPNIDIIFCRNVIIYFDAETTQRVIENFYDSLAEGGYLFLGHTETLWQIKNKFERVEFPQTFIYKKTLNPAQGDPLKPFMAVPELAVENLTLSAAPSPALDQSRPWRDSGAALHPNGSGPAFFEARGEKDRSESILSPRPETSANSVESLGPKGEPSSSRFESKPTGRGVKGSTFTQKTGKEKSSFQHKLKSGHQEISGPLDQMEKTPDVASPSSPDHMIAQDKNYFLTCLTKATILANEAKYKEAADILGKIIEVDNLSVEAYYLLGVLSYKSGDLKEAETQFRKVIYVTPDSVLAYFNLGNMYLYQRKFSAAVREFKNAIRLLEKRPKDEQVRFCEDFTVEFLLRACRNTLVQISKRGE